MSKKRQCHSEQFKAKVALAAVRGDKTLGELAKQFQVNPAQIVTWKQRRIDSVHPEHIDRCQRSFNEILRKDIAEWQSSVLKELTPQISYLLTKTSLLRMTHPGPPCR